MDDKIRVGRIPARTRTTSRSRAANTAMHSSSAASRHPYNRAQQSRLRLQAETFGGAAFLIHSETLARFSEFYSGDSRNVCCRVSFLSVLVAALIGFITIAQSSSLPRHMNPSSSHRKRRKPILRARSAL